MSELTESDVAKPGSGKYESNESVLMKTVRLMINLMTNMLMCLTVFVSLLYACSSEKITVFQLHIILCVLGYQFFMCQGTLVLSRHNSWSLFLNRHYKKHLHILLQITGFLLILVGSSVMIIEESRHFDSTHASLGVLSLIFSIVSILNGAAAIYAYKLSRSYIFLIKFLHYFCGILTLFLSAAALSTGFQEFPFRIWAKDDNAVAALIIITWAFTFFVALDFWLLTGQRFRNLL